MTDTRMVDLMLEIDYARLIIRRTYQGVLVQVKQGIPPAVILLAEGVSDDRAKAIEQAFQQCRSGGHLIG